MKHYLLLGFLFYLFTYSTCKKEKQHREITIVNSSSDTIISLLQYNYPDTLIQDSATAGFDVVSINPNQKNANETFGSSYEYLIEFNNPFNTLSIFIYSSDTIKKYTWSQIQDQYRILKRYDLNIDELDSLDWTIHYP